MGTIVCIGEKTNKVAVLELDGTRNLAFVDSTLAALVVKSYFVLGRPCEKAVLILYVGVVDI